MKTTKTTKKTVKPSFTILEDREMKSRDTVMKFLTLTFGNMTVSLHKSNHTANRKMAKKWTLNEIVRGQDYKSINRKFIYVLPKAVANVIKKEYPFEIYQAGKGPFGKGEKQIKIK